MDEIGALLRSLGNHRTGTRRFKNGDEVIGIGGFSLIDVAAQEAELEGYVTRKEHRSGRQLGFDSIDVTITEAGRYIKSLDATEGQA